MSMFCYQCEQTAKGTGCDIQGVCGKSPEVALKKAMKELAAPDLEPVKEVQFASKLGASSCRAGRPRPSCHRRIPAGSALDLHVR